MSRHLQTHYNSKNSWVTEKEFRFTTDAIRQDVDFLKQDFNALKQDVNVLKQDVHVLKHDVNVLKQDVHVLKQDVHLLKQDVGDLKINVESLRKTTQYEMVLMRKEVMLEISESGKRTLLWMFSMLSGVTGTLLTVMAKGFNWI